MIFSKIRFSSHTSTMRLQSTKARKSSSQQSPKPRKSSTQPMKSVFLIPEADRRKRSIVFELDYVNDFKDSYRVRRVTICDDKPLGILIEQVSFNGDKKKILTMITRVKGNNN